MKNSFYLFALIVLLSACDKDDNTVVPDDTPSRSGQVDDLLQSYATSDTSQAMKSIHHDNFKQHNLQIADGLEGMISAITEGMLQGAKVSTERMFVDGDFVITHSSYELEGLNYAGFNVFKYSDNKIIEHWDNLQVVEAPNPSNRTMLDGPTEIESLDETALNKAVVSEFIQSVLISGERDQIESYFDGNNLVQHSPNLQDSLSSFTTLLDDYTEQDVTYRYDKLHQVLGEGNFVLAMSEGIIDTAATAFYDLYRLENGKIAEHWDVITTIPPSSTWAHSNGKF